MDNKYEEVSVTPIKRSKKKKKKFNGKAVIIILIVAAVILAGVAVFIHFTSRLDNDSYENCALGDVNGDGYINSADSGDIMKYLGGEQLFPNQIAHGDVNQDGKLDKEDANIIQRYSIGEIKALPYTEKTDESEPNGKRADDETDKIISTVRIFNNWDNEDGTHSYQLNISIKNISGSEIDSWKSLIDINSDVKIAESWDCKSSVEGNQLTISGKSIGANSTATCGIIVTGTDELIINNIETE